MTIQELIDHLKVAPDLSKEVIIAVYHPDDSGEQDHYTPFDTLIYDDGHIEIKCN